ncbi:Holliday junction branch migration protein RuvA [bacterium]|nr:Holliday junction branch migration protein RuvA [bacterium]
MYDYIKGFFTYKNIGSNAYNLTIEANGIGYSIEVLERDFDLFTEENREAKLFTVLIHKEDRMSLCGFLKREDRDMFSVLTSVSGVGTKMALALLNTYNVAELINFVIDEDYKSIMCAKGVGQKLAQKIIIELKGKINSYKDSYVDLKVSNKVAQNENIEDAKMVLMSLGYEKNEISSALEKALKSVDANSETEEILRKSLQILSI